MQAVHKKWVYFGITMFVGAIFGSIMIRTLPSEQYQYMSNTIHQYIFENASDGVEANWSYLGTTLWKHMKWVLLILVAGITIIGTPLLAVINFLKGFFIGCSIQVFIQIFGSAGAWLSIMTIAPQNLIMIPLFVVMSSYAMQISGNMLKRIKKHPNDTAQFMNSALGMKLIIVALLIGLASIIEVFVSPSLMDWYLAYLGAEPNFLLKMS